MPLAPSLPGRTNGPGEGLQGRRAPGSPVAPRSPFERPALGGPFTLLSTPEAGLGVRPARREPRLLVLELKRPSGGVPVTPFILKVALAPVTGGGLGDPLVRLPLRGARSLGLAWRIGLAAIVFTRVRFAGLVIGLTVDLLHRGLPPSGTRRLANKALLAGCKACAPGREASLLVNAPAECHEICDWRHDV